MNVPNALSLFRLLLVPVFPWIYFSGQPDARLWAALVYTAALLTDILDGWIARRFHQVTRLGRVLDPLADKLMTFTVMLCVCLDGILPMWAAAVFFLKETVMTLGGAALIRHTSDVIPANWLGKASTGTFFVVLAVLLLFPRRIPRSVATILISLSLLLSLASLIRYILDYRKIMGRLPEEK